jgi:murein DD-endopeptidase MepM/ murein hydrolase activator NlpD
LRLVSIAGFVLAAGIATAAAEAAMQSPKLDHAEVDWQAVATELATLGPFTTTGLAELTVQPLDHLNRATADFFTNVAASAAPVLLPFDTPAFLRDREAGVPNRTINDYLPGFKMSPFFVAGPSGYDTVLHAYARDLPGLGLTFSDRIDIHISGSTTLYQIGEPAGMINWPARELKADIPDIRRVYLENYARYTFTRYGTLYVVAILCFDGGSRYRQVSCRDADKIATRFIRALHLVGGAPQPASAPPEAIQRPMERSTVFTYRPAGQIIPGTGYKGHGGRADPTVYAEIRFPLADAPAFANSQSFMNWGDCDHTGRSSLGMRGRVAAYRCRVGGPTLINDESAAANFSYPWRDNFCEHRHFYVGQCPGGSGHQGQDIRPGWCKQRIEGANRCEPYLHDVVAVRDGTVLRAPNQQAFFLVVNEPSEHIRFRYLHMFPKQLDESGIISGRAVREGEIVGKVGNFDRRERATTYHLHFEMQVFSHYGWVFANPFMTLVAGYERLIRGRGEEIGEDAPTGTVPRIQDLPASTASSVQQDTETSPDQ